MGGACGCHGNRLPHLLQRSSAHLCHLEGGLRWLQGEVEAAGGGMYVCVCPTCMHLYSPCPRVHAHMHTLKHLTHVRMHTHPSMSTSLTNKLVSVVFVLLSHNSIVSFSFGCTCSMNMCTHAHTYIHMRTHMHTHTHRAKIYSYRFASTSSKLTAW